MTLRTIAPVAHVGKTDMAKDSARHCIAAYLIGGGE